MGPGLFRRRPLTALQVEVTSRCTRQCAVCPRTALASVWREGDLGDAAWAVLRRDLGLRSDEALRLIHGMLQEARETTLSHCPHCGKHLHDE